MAEILALATAALEPGRLSGNKNGSYPRVDYVELQEYFDMDVMDYDAYRGRKLGDGFRWLETRLRTDLYLAMLGFARHNRYRMAFAWSERVGIPFAAMRSFLGSSHPFAAMFTCWSYRQEMVITRLKLFDYMDTIAVHSKSMRQNFARLGVPKEKLKLIHYSIDDKFFTPKKGIKQIPGRILSLGEIRSRDYASLFDAVEGLDIDLLVAASGSWYARENETSLQIRIPENVALSGGFSQAELKTQYAQAQFVVLPLYDLVYSAGATASMEAMSMGRAVVAFRSQGILDYIIDGETGILIEPGNSEAMRDAITYLLANPAEARRMGENGRQRVKEYLNLDRYVRQVSEWLRGEC
jgi:glycosyltransferase involved in cell wall biosynthesis